MKFIVNTIILLLLAGSTFVTFSCWLTLITNVKTNISPFSNYEYWNKLEPIILLENENNYNKEFIDDNRRLVYICDTFNYDSVFYAEDRLVSYFDNRYLKGKQESQLKDHMGEISYIVYSRTSFKLNIGQDYIHAELYIRNAHDNKVVGYVNKKNFNKHDYTIFNKNGKEIINIKYNEDSSGLKKIIITPTLENKLPLKLALGISSIYIYDFITSECNLYYVISFILSWIFLGCFFIFTIYYFYTILTNRDGTPRRRTGHYV
jgi:hypothetical protein